MALESGELAAATALRHLARLREEDARPTARGGVFDALAREYRDQYRTRFGARLRVCSYLRRAAFAPRGLTELGVAALGASERVRRVVARATR
jgi:hypothetical protein